MEHQSRDVTIISPQHFKSRAQVCIAMSSLGIRAVPEADPRKSHSRKDMNLLLCKIT